MSDENEKIYLFDSLVGILKKDYDYRRKSRIYEKI